MYRWFLLLTCGCAILPGSAQVPDPGTMAQELPRSSSLLVHPDQGTLLADVSARALSPSGIPLLTTPNTIRDDSQTPVPAADQVSASTTAPAAPALDLPYDASNIRDTIGPISIRPLPDAAGQLPVCFQQVDYFRKHNDNIMAIAYLRQLITYGNFIPQYKARAILELADCLDAAHQKAEALCWLKIWAELFPARPEMGSVAYRIATLYTQMGLSDLARDAYYLALAHTVNDGQVQSAVDLKSYSRLTEATLWGLSANEYQSGNWARAAELFERYRKEAPFPWKKPPISKPIATTNSSRPTRRRLSTRRPWLNTRSTRLLPKRACVSIISTSLRTSPKRPGRSSNHWPGPFAPSGRRTKPTGRSKPPGCCLPSTKRTTSSCLLWFRSQPSFRRKVKLGKRLSITMMH